jgi:hypothetical protein
MNTPKIISTDLEYLKSDLRRLALEHDQATEFAYAMAKPRMTKPNKISDRIRVVVIKIFQSGRAEDILMQLMADPEDAVKREAATWLLLDDQMAPVAREELERQSDKYRGTWRSVEISMLVSVWERGLFHYPASDS